MRGVGILITGVIESVGQQRCQRRGPAREVVTLLHHACVALRSQGHDVLLLTNHTHIDDDLRVSAPPLTSTGNKRHKDEETSRRSKAATAGSTASHLENLLHRQPAAFL